MRSVALTGDACRIVFDVAQMELSTCGALMLKLAARPGTISKNAKYGGNTGTGDQGHQRGVGDEEEHDEGCGTGGVPRQRCQGINTAGTFAEACEEVDIDQPGTQGGHPVNLSGELQVKLV